MTWFARLVKAGKVGNPYRDAEGKFTSKDKAVSSLWNPDAVADAIVGVMSGTTPSSAKKLISSEAKGVLRVNPQAKPSELADKLVAQLSADPEMEKHFAGAEDWKKIRSALQDMSAQAAPVAAAPPVEKPPAKEKKKAPAKKQRHDVQGAVYAAKLALEDHPIGLNHSKLLDGLLFKAMTRKGHWSSRWKARQVFRELQANPETAAYVAKTRTMKANPLFQKLFSAFDGARLDKDVPKPAEKPTGQAGDTVDKLLSSLEADLAADAAGKKPEASKPEPSVEIPVAEQKKPFKWDAEKATKDVMSALGGTWLESAHAGKLQAAALKEATIAYKAQPENLAAAIVFQLGKDPELAANQTFQAFKDKYKESIHLALKEHKEKMLAEATPAKPEEKPVDQMTDDELLAALEAVPIKPVESAININHAPKLPDSWYVAGYLSNSLKGTDLYQSNKIKVEQLIHDAVAANPDLLIDPGTMATKIVDKFVDNIDNMEEYSSSPHNTYGGPLAEGLKEYLANNPPSAKPTAASNAQAASKEPAVTPAMFSFYVGGHSFLTEDGEKKDAKKIIDKVVADLGKDFEYFSPDSLAFMAYKGFEKSLTFGGKFQNFPPSSGDYANVTGTNIYKDLKTMFAAAQAESKAKPASNPAMDAIADLNAEIDKISAGKLFDQHKLSSLLATGMNSAEKAKITELLVDLDKAMSGNTALEKAFEAAKFLEGDYPVSFGMLSKETKDKAVQSLKAFYSDLEKSKGTPSSAKAPEPTKHAITSIAQIDAALGGIYGYHDDEAKKKKIQTAVVDTEAKYGGKISAGEKAMLALKQLYPEASEGALKNSEFYKKLKALYEGGATTTTTSPAQPAAPTLNAAEMTVKETKGFKSYEDFNEFKSTLGKGNLKHKEVSSLSDYQGSKYQEINKALRTNSLMSSDLAEYVTNISNAIANSPATTEKTVLFRGVDSFETVFKTPVSQMESVIGKAISDNGFMSASTSRSFAKSWAAAEASSRGKKDPVLIQLLVPKGTKGAIINVYTQTFHSEQEFLMQRGTFIKVRSVRKEGNVVVVTAEVKYGREED